MQWSEIREHYPERWLLVEATRAHSSGERRILDDLAVLDSFPDSREAWSGYAERHRQAPSRELYVCHTSREILEIIERSWLGIRSA